MKKHYLSQLILSETRSGEGGVETDGEDNTQGSHRNKRGPFRHGCQYQ